MANPIGGVGPSNLSEALIASTLLTVEERVHESKSDPILENLYRSRSFKFMIWWLLFNMTALFLSVFLFFGVIRETISVQYGIPPIFETGMRTYVLEWGVWIVVINVLLLAPVVCLPFSQKLR